VAELVLLETMVAPVLLALRAKLALLEVQVQLALKVYPEYSPD
jgi:hypothetical protein